MTIHMQRKSENQFVGDVQYLMEQDHGLRSRRINIQQMLNDKSFFHISHEMNQHLRQY